MVGTGGNYLTRLKYCNTCYIYRPERAFHCNFCGNCIHNFDHHCKWLGTCIGGRTYKQFVLFLFSLAMLQWCCIAYCLSHITLLIIHLNDDYELDDSFREAFSKFPTTAVVIFFCLVVAGFVSNLLLYHIKLICKSESTYEEKKKHFKDTLFNPYKRSFCHNLFCKKRPPKFYDLTDLEPPKPEDSNRTLSMKTVSAAAFR